jgi:hypothetical protein
MARVKALVTVFVDNHYRTEGDVFNYDGPFNRHLEYLDGKPAQQEAVVSDEESPAPKLRRGRPPKSATSASS